LGFIKTKILPFAIVALFGIAFLQLVQEFGCQEIWCHLLQWI